MILSAEIASHLSSGSQFTGNGNADSRVIADAVGVSSGAYPIRRRDFEGAISVHSSQFLSHLPVTVGDMGLQEWIRRHALVAFGLVAFGWTWGWDATFFAFDLWDAIPISVPRVWGPAIAAVVVMWAGEASLREWVRRRLDWRVSPRYVLIALAVPTFITNVQPVVESLGGGSVVYDPPAAIYLLFAFIAVNAVLLGGTEELGWRGVVQPRLQQRMSVFASGLVVGAVWLVWHLPLFFTGNPNYSFEPAALLAYALTVLGSSVVLGALVNATEGNVLPAIVMHASVNAGAFLGATGGLLEGSSLVPLLVGSGLWWVLAGILVASYGPSMTPKPDVEPLESRVTSRPAD